MSTVLQSMELAEISQRLAFLDEERRKDRELIASLLERVEAQNSIVESQKRQIQELEGLLSSTRAELVKFTHIERAMQQLREELIMVVETNEEKRHKSYQELTRLRQVEQETVTRQLAELRNELRPIPRYDEEIQSLRAEVGRYNAPLVTLQHQFADLDKRSEDRVQSVVFLEEQRRQDNRRIAQVEAEILKLKKEIVDLVDRLPLLEQAIQTKNKDIDRAAELLQQQAEVIENQRVSEFRWERQVAEWAKLVEQLKQETANMTTYTVRMREQQELARRALAELEPFRERIERRQNEMAEIQRLAEDRQKRVLEAWQNEREKERERFKLDNEERWRENAHFNEKRHARLEAIEAYLRELNLQIEALWDIHEAWAESIMIGPREWLATWSELAKQRPAMPELPKPVSLAPPEDLPKIRPLPSAKTTHQDEEEM
jgi:DNA repair exonuclease SbcCD ATPase subunit